MVDNETSSIVLGVVSTNSIVFCGPYSIRFISFRHGALLMFSYLSRGVTFDYRQQRLTFIASHNQGPGLRGYAGCPSHLPDRLSTEVYEIHVWYSFILSQGRHTRISMTFHTVHHHRMTSCVIISEFIL